VIGVAAAAHAVNRMIDAAGGIEFIVANTDCRRCGFRARR